MSFSSEQKALIIEQPIKSRCCLRAFLNGVLSAKGELSQGLITVSVENLPIAEYIKAAVFNLYGKTAEIIPPPKGGRCKLVTFFTPSAAKYLNDFYSGKAVFENKCELCRAHYFKGVFLAGGRVSDPLKQYNLEFSLKKSIDRIAEIFESIGLIPRISDKPNERVIYFKNSGAIEDFFGFAGMNNAAFSLMNAKIQGEIRNNANRIVNCETNNIDKAVSASMSQIELIEALLDKGLISQLPDELEATARLRMEYRDLSISQLAMLTNPRISKPGLSHRLKRITEIARSLLGE